MPERKDSDEKAHAFFEDIWKAGDPWELETSPFEQDKYDREIAILGGRAYGRTLELGCGAGAFTRRLSRISGEVVALDVSSTAIARGRAMLADVRNVDLRVQNIMDYKPASEGPWDLIVINETIYYLGWLYTFFEVAWFASELCRSTQTGGHLLMANTSGGVEDYLLWPSIIKSYRDVFVNTGYEIAAEEVFTGTKSGASLEVPISLFVRSR